MKTPENEMLVLNPSPVDIIYGIRTAKKFKIWPLAVGAQMELSKKISEAMAEFINGDDSSEAAMVGFAVNTVRENIAEIVQLIVDEEVVVSELFLDMSNDQMVNLCFQVYEMNYKATIKNLKSLFKKISPIFLSERPAPLSAQIMGTDSKTSSESPSETED